MLTYKSNFIKEIIMTTIKISKRQWEFIGKQAGWVKKANNGDGQKRIRIAYGIVTPESASIGDYAKTGWIDKKGVVIESVDDAIEFLRNNGAVYPSSSHFHPRCWYSDDGNTNFRTGAVETRSYHLVGFSEDEQEAIFAAIEGV